MSKNDLPLLAPGAGAPVAADIKPTEAKNSDGPTHGKPAQGKPVEGKPGGDKPTKTGARRGAKTKTVPAPAVPASEPRNGPRFPRRVPLLGGRHRVGGRVVAPEPPVAINPFGDSGPDKADPCPAMRGIRRLAGLPMPGSDA